MAGTGTLAGPIKTPNSYGSVVNNGQLVGVQTSPAYYPKNYGGGISFVGSVSPVTSPPSVGYGMGGPPTASSPGGLSSLTNGTVNRGTYTGKTMGSPAVWAFGLMAFGLVWLRFVHWRKPTASEPAGE
jgi:hypothetical protein